MTDGSRGTQLICVCQFRGAGLRLSIFRMPDSRLQVINDFQNFVTTLFSFPQARLRSAEPTN